jgi:hypothetical protein
MNHLSVSVASLAVSPGDLELFRFFDNGVQSNYTSEREYINDCLSKLQANKDTMYQAITNELAAEQAAWVKYEEASQNLMRKLKATEATRRQATFTANLQHQRVRRDSTHTLMHRSRATRFRLTREASLEIDQTLEFDMSFTLPRTRTLGTR